MTDFMKYWLLIPIALLLASGTIFLGQSSDTARLNRHLDHLKYTDFVALWWTEGDQVRFVCAPDDAEGVMREKGVHLPAKQAVYTSFLVAKQELLDSPSPVQMITDRLSQALSEAENIHMSEYTWDRLYQKAYFRHFGFRLSSVVYWSSLIFSLLGGVVLMLWSRKRMILGGVFICLVGLMFSGWWHLNPPPLLSSADSEIVWTWCVAGYHPSN